MEKLFKLKENGTNVRTEIVAGLTTFMTMAYIIAPAIVLMLMNIGIGSNAGIYSETVSPFYAMCDFYDALTPSVAQNAMVLTAATMFSCTGWHADCFHYQLSQSGKLPGL